MRTSVAVGDVARGEDLVGEFGAGFEGEGFGEDEGVVAVEEEGCYLWRCQLRCAMRDWAADGAGEAGCEVWSGFIHEVNRGENEGRRTLGAILID